MFIAQKHNKCTIYFLTRVKCDIKKVLTDNQQICRILYLGLSRTIFSSFLS